MAQEALSRTQLYRSKLKSQEEHLHSLIRKQARILQEIQALKKTIRAQKKVFEKETQKPATEARNFHETLGGLLDDYNPALEGINAELNLEIKQILRLQAKIQAEIEDLRKLLRLFEV